MNQKFAIRRSYKVDSYSSFSMSSSSSNSMNIILSSLVPRGKVIINNHIDCMYINPPTKKIRRNQHSSLSRFEYFHNLSSLLTIHISMDSGYLYTFSFHVFGNFSYLFLRIRKDYSLFNFNIHIDFLQSRSLIFFFINRNVELFNSLRSYFIIFP